MVSISGSLSLTLTLACTILLLLPEQTPADNGADILIKFNKKLESNPEYSAFFKAYFKSFAPLAVFKELNAGRKLTMFIPSKAAFAKLKQSLTSDQTKFGNLVSNHCAKTIVDYNVWKKSNVGKYWTANYRNRKIYRDADGVTLSDAKPALKEKVTWNVFSSANLVVHAVSNYTITSEL